MWSEGIIRIAKTAGLRRWILFGTIGVAVCLMVPCATAQETEGTLEWHSWLEELRDEFVTEGISPRTFSSALAGSLPDARVLEADWKQPEFTRPIWEYLESAVSEQRIRQGREMLVRHSDLLSRIVQRYGVEAEILVAIWGIETNYGSNRGGFHVPRSLATLAYGGMRRNFGRKQLLAAMQLLQEGVMSAGEMLGSWAGAIGHMQFLPTTYQSHGVDFNGDGRRDLYGSEADALASAARYLKISGWRSGEIWGMEITLPEDFDYGLAQSSIRKSGRYWMQLGVLGGQTELPRGPGHVLLPAGHRGAAFLVLENFAVLKTYNPSIAYALAVGRLADCLRGCKALAGSWPLDEEVLSRTEKMNLQRRLTALGYDTKGIDGIVGPATRGALREWQSANREIADGHPTRKILWRLEESAGQQESGHHPPIGQPDHPVTTVRQPFIMGNQQ